MTLKQFFAKLPKDGWTLSGYYGDRIRRDDYCPICAVLGDPTCRVSWPEAARDLGLPITIGRRIANAADNDSPHMITPTEYRIRRLLVAHCNLTEPATA